MVLNPMADPLLPRTTSARHAAILSGRSVRGFVRDLLPRVSDGNGRVATDKLECAIGVPITCEMWMEADRRLDQRRAQQRQWEAEHGRP